jgi:hypothetical protein
MVFPINGGSLYRVGRDTGDELVSRVDRVTLDGAIPKASAREEGISLPRVFIRSTNFARAPSLKKYFGDTLEVSSRTEESEDSTARLRDSEKSRVKHPPSSIKPAESHRFEEGGEIPSSVRGQNSGDIFPNNPTRFDTMSESRENESKVPSRVGEPEFKPGRAE